MTTAMAAPQHRERGTLQRTFPSPMGIIAVFCIVCTGASTYLSQHSLNEQVSKTDVLLLGLKSGLGVCSSTYSIFFSDPHIHLISYAIDLLLSVLVGEHISLSLSDLRKVGPAIAIFTLSRLNSFRSICAVLENKVFLNNFNLSICCIVPLIATFVYSSHMSVSLSQQDSNIAALSFVFAPSICIGILTLLISNAHYRRRSHKTGNLTQGQICGALIVGITIINITKSFANDEQSALQIMPFMIGAVFTAGAAASFAGVADVWYAVGTGQWQMISVDTASIMFYFALPIWILGIRFFEKYGNFFEDNISSVFAQKIALLFDVKSLTGADEVDIGDIRNYAYTSLVTFLSVIVAIVIPLVKSMSPICGYIYGYTFIHGEQNSKCIAVAVHFSELFHSSIKDQEREQVWKALSLWQKGASMGKDGGKKYSMQTDGILNIVVTAADLKESADTIKMLKKNGHCIAITISKGESSNSIQRAYEEYQKLFGHPPQWYHTGDTILGDTPTCFSAASKLTLKCAKWSIYLSVGNELSDDQQTCLEAELLEHQGGSIVWLHLLSESAPFSLSGMIQVLNKIFNLEGIKMLPTSLSHVIVDKNRMDLE